MIVIFTALFLLPPQFSHRHQTDTGDQSHNAAKQRRLPRFSRPLNEDPPTADGAGLHVPTPPAGSVAGYIADLSDPESDPDTGRDDVTDFAPEAGETPIEPKILRGRLT